MEIYTGGVTNYHAANACGPDKQDNFLSYELQFRCKPNDPVTIQINSKRILIIKTRLNTLMDTQKNV